MLTVSGFQDSGGDRWLNPLVGAEPGKESLAREAKKRY